MLSEEGLEAVAAAAAAVAVVVAVVVVVEGGGGICRDECRRDAASE